MLLPDRDPRPAYDDYEQVRALAGPRGRFMDRADITRMESVAAARGRRWCSSPQTFVMMHAGPASTAGQRVGLCLFGSMDNLRGRLRDTDNFEAG